ncbi:MAG: type II toxin-antitoxin system VapC family toxin [Desulfobacterales bacterium]|nr:type II toxin-antitoxin system VapC family toxin [Desulfobacterales bacterium]
MNKDRIFLDTAYVLALLNRRDQYHDKAKFLLDRVRKASEIWLTEAILVEIGNALSSVDREGAANFIISCYNTSVFHVVTVDTELMHKAVKLYQSKNDKDWGLTDCISFVVMKESELYLAMTTDKHFCQAGFQALMLE